MKYIFFFLFPMLSDDLYKFRMIINIETITTELPDGSTFQVVSRK